MKPLFVGIVATLALALSTGSALAGKTLVFHDSAGDTRAKDLDLRTAFVTINGSNAAVKIVLGAGVRDNSIYSAYFTCGPNYWQVGAKRAAGDDSFFLTSFKDYKNTYIKGDFSGRTVLVDAPADKMGCTKGKVKVSFVAEGTNGRAPMTDKIPAKVYRA